VEDEFPSDGDNHWSIRPPSNDKSTIEPHFNDETILLADARVLGNMWYESEGIFSDNYTYAVTSNTTPTGQNPYVNLICDGDSCLINYSAPVEVSVFPSTLYLSRGKMEVAGKFNYSIDRDDGLFIKFWDSKKAHNEDNYTTTVFFNADYKSNGGTKLLDFYYCNNSYDMEGGIPPQDEIDSCVYLNSMSKSNLDTKTYSSRNSSYVHGVYGVIDGKIGGIETTNYSYGYLRSVETATFSYYIRYANGTSGTNVSFNESKVAWYSTDDGDSFTQAEFTPDIWFSQITNASLSEIGIYVKDLLGNNYTNFTFKTDEIGDINFPISNPKIHAYQNFYNTNTSNHDGENEDLNGTYNKNMTVHINIAIDPDSVGNVTHNLTLHNIDGSLNYTINGSFKSIDDSDVHIIFDTADVFDGDYRMNITAISGDDSTDIKSFMQVNNFTIDNTNPNVLIISPVNETNTTNNGININYTVSDSGIGLDTCWYSNDTYSENTTITCGNNITDIVWTDDYHNFTLWTNDSVNNINKSVIIFIVDTTPPIFDPALENQTLPETNALSYDIDAVDVGVGLESITINDTHGGLFTINSGTGLLENASTFIGQSGEYLFNVTINDTLNNLHNQILLVNVTPIDATSPNLNITFPINNTNHSDNTLPVNYSVSDNTALDTCWYSNDTMSENTTITCGNNITDVIWIEGQHNVTVWANDTSNNLNISSVTFYIDTIAPFLNITFPINYTNTTDNTLPINYSVSADVDTCWYSNDTYSENTTIACGTNITTITWTDDQHNFTLWANDSFNNINESFVTFLIDTTPPIFSPALENQTLGDNESLSYDIDAVDVGIGLESITINDTHGGLFTINSGTGLLENASSLLDQVGEFLFNVTINDSLNNEHSQILNVSITNSTIIIVDTTPPTWDNLRNFTHITNTSFSEFMTASDDVGIDTYVLNDTSIFNISQSGLITNVTNLSRIEIQYLNITINDTSNNIVSAIFYINITLAPLPSGSQCTENVTLLKTAISNNRPYGRLCFWLDFR